MFILLYCILCGLVQISLGSTSNEAKHYHKILKSLNNATEFNVKALDLLLEKLNLEHCKYEPIREESCPEKVSIQLYYIFMEEIRHFYLLSFIFNPFYFLFVSSVWPS